MRSIVDEQIESFMETTATERWINLSRPETQAASSAPIWSAVTCHRFVLRPKQSADESAHSISGHRRAAHFTLCLIGAWLALVFFTAAPARGQQKIQDTDKTPSKSESEPAHLRNQLAEATRDYKANLGKLAAIYEADARQAEGRLQKMKELSAQGLITRREVEASEDAAARARDKVVDARAQLKIADVQLAEALVEVEAEETAPKLRLNPAPRAVGGLVHTTAYIRYGGGHAWSLSDAGAIKQFFMLRFGRQLPIHVFGQSPLHDRWGYDHRNAMDIGLNPDSAEGQALVEYLRANGVPFTAFHFAIPGVATGPHVHVGLPSHRITATVASR